MSQSHSPDVLELKAGVRIVAALVELELLRRGLDQRMIADELEPRQAYELGRLIEAADAAKDAVFNVLNTASSYCDSAAAEEAITNWQGIRAELAAGS